MTKYDRRIISASAAVLTPCILGIVGMSREGMPVGIWIQNPIAIVVLAFAAMAAGRLGVRIPAKAAVIASVLLLGLTFPGQGIDGVHRWLRLPGFTLNAAAVVLPTGVAALTRLATERQTVWVSFGIAGIALLLYLQPDASQLLAFSLPMIVLLVGADFPKALKLGGSVLLATLTLLSWLHPDNLPPVSHTEGILEILHGQSPMLYIAGILALLWVPVRFMVGASPKGRRMALNIALYYALMILASFPGNFPVPFMGYGISPILGYYLNCLNREPHLPSKRAKKGSTERSQHSLKKRQYVEYGKTGHNEHPCVHNETTREQFIAIIRIIARQPKGSLPEGAVTAGD